MTADTTEALDLGAPVTLPDIVHALPTLVSSIDNATAQLDPDDVTGMLAALGVLDKARMQIALIESSLTLLLEPVMGGRAVTVLGFGTFQPHRSKESERWDAPAAVKQVAETLLADENGEPVSAAETAMAYRAVQATADCIGTPPSKKWSVTGLRARGINPDDGDSPLRSFERGRFSIQITPAGE
jgi:hypothetical protein